jgi:hypothetical protein
MLEQLEGASDEQLAAALAATKAPAAPPEVTGAQAPGNSSKRGPDGPREYNEAFFPPTGRHKAASAQAREERGGGGSYA